MTKKQFAALRAKQDYEVVTTTTKTTTENALNCSKTIDAILDIFDVKDYQKKFNNRYRLSRNGITQIK